jgi:hypothetical protein
MKAEKIISKAQSLWLVSAAYVVAIAVAVLWLVWGVSTGRGEFSRRSGVTRNTG